MTSKIDFNHLLAKADKNANDARKQLEDKKRVNQDRPHPSSKQQPPKQSAIAFITQRKEEIRKRNEQEARELLEKKKKRDALQNQQVAQKKSTATTTSNTKTVSKDAVQKYLNSKNQAAPTANSLINSNKKPPDQPRKPTPNSNSRPIPNSKSKPTNVTQKQPVAASKTGTRSYYDTIPVENVKPPISSDKIKSSLIKPASASGARSYYDSVPKTTVKQPISSDKIKNPPAPVRPPIKVMNKNMPTTVKPSLQKIPIKKSVSVAPKQVLSYNQMLKIAENCHKDKVTNKGEVKSEVGSTKNIDLYLNKKDKEKKTAEHSVVPVAPVSAKHPPVTNHSKFQSSHMRQQIDPKLQVKNLKVAVPVAENNKGVSSWDRVVSDMKKKPVKKLKIPDMPEVEYEEEDDEEDYDSEMDDFIDDESGDEKLSKKEYSKTIQEIFKYDPKRYKNIKEDDLDNMETNYHSLLQEEKMSLKMAIQEDHEEAKREAEREKQRDEKLKKRQLDDAKDSNNNKKLKTNKT